MTIVAIDHVQLAMPPGGEDQARAFYRDLLGIPEVSKPPHLAARGGCWFEDGPIKVHLGVEQDFRPARKAHPALRVASEAELDDLTTLLTTAGHPVTDGDPGQRYVDDPFGNRIELVV